MNNYILGFDINKKNMEKWLEKNHIQWDDKTHPLIHKEVPNGWEIVNIDSTYYINLIRSTDIITDILTSYDQSDIKGVRKLARKLKSFGNARIILPYTGEEYVTIEDFDSHKEIEVELEKQIIIGWPLDYDETRKWVDKKKINWYDARDSLTNRRIPEGWGVIKTMTNGDPYEASFWLGLGRITCRPSLHELKIIHETELEEAREFARKLGSSENEAKIIITTTIDDDHWPSIHY